MKTLYFGGTILTMEPRALYAEAILTENGRILAVGEKARLAAQAPGAQTVNLDGAVLMPAFMDAHSHFSQVASGLLQVSLDGAADPDEMRRRIDAFCRETGPAEWVIARDYDNNLLPGAQDIEIEVLDSLAGDHPLVLQHKSGHMGLFNSAALTALGISPQTPEPEGGRIEKKAGHLTGRLEENAYFAAIRKVPAAAPEKMQDAYARAQQKYASYGITTVQEGMLVQQMLPLYKTLLSKDLLRLDLVAYPDLPSLRAVQNALPAQGQQKHFRIGGVKIFLDGSPQGRTAWMRTPYQGTPETCGYGTMSDEAVEVAMETAVQNGMQLLAHCNGDAAAAQLLRCLAACEARYPQMRGLRPVMIHAQLLGVDQIPQAVELGVTASFFAAHVWQWGDVHIRNFGARRAAQISPAASALRAGLPFTFHQDAPVVEPDMLQTVWCAVNRRTRAGVTLGPEERISAFEALRAVTSSAARQYFEENEKGTLRTGKRADFVILGENPLTVAPDSIRKIPVLQTIKDGETVYLA